MALMNRILDAYQARETSPDYVQWEKDHPEDTELLAYAARIENE